MRRLGDTGPDMAQPRILVAFASRNGGTGQIAEWISDELQRAGLSVDLRDVRLVESIDEYDTVVLGSAVYMRRWQRAARAFLRHHVGTLTQRQVWLFSSGPVDPGTVVPNDDIPLGLGRLAARVNAHQHITFGGRLELDAADWSARTLARRGMAGDFRDETAVRNWATTIADSRRPSDQQA